MTVEVIAHTVAIGLIVLMGQEDGAHMVVGGTLVVHQGKIHVSGMVIIGEAVHLAAPEVATQAQATQVKYSRVWKDRCLLQNNT